MGIEYREKTIGEHTYRVTHLGTKQGLKLLVRLTKITGPGVGSFIGGIGRGPDEFGASLALGTAEGIHDLAARLNEDEVLAIAIEFARQTVVVLPNDVQPTLADIFDDHFAGRYDLLLQWLAFCLEVNYRSFFAGRSGDGPLRKLWALLSQLQSQRTSNGTSTASQPAASTPSA